MMWRIGKEKTVVNINQMLEMDEKFLLTLPRSLTALLFHGCGEKVRNVGQYKFTIRLYYFL